MWGRDEMASFIIVLACGWAFGKKLCYPDLPPQFVLVPAAKGSDKKTLSLSWDRSHPACTCHGLFCARESTQDGWWSPQVLNPGRSSKDLRRGSVKTTSKPSFITSNLGIDQGCSQDAQIISHQIWPPWSLVSDPFLNRHHLPVDLPRNSARVHCGQGVQRHQIESFTLDLLTSEGLEKYETSSSRRSPSRGGFPVGLKIAEQSQVTQILQWPWSAPSRQ